MVIKGLLKGAVMLIVGALLSFGVAGLLETRASLNHEASVRRLNDAPVSVATTPGPIGRSAVRWTF